MLTDPGGPPPRCSPRDGPQTLRLLRKISHGTHWFRAMLLVPATNVVWAASTDKSIALFQPVRRLEPLSGCGGKHSWLGCERMKPRFESSLINRRPRRATPCNRNGGVFLFGTQFVYTLNRSSPWISLSVPSLCPRHEALPPPPPQNGEPHCVPIAPKGRLRQPGEVQCLEYDPETSLLWAADDITLRIYDAEACVAHARQPVGSRMPPWVSRSHMLMSPLLHPPPFAHPLLSSILPPPRRTAFFSDHGAFFPHHAEAYHSPLPTPPLGLHFLKPRGGSKEGLT